MCGYWLTERVDEFDLDACKGLIIKQPLEDYLVYSATTYYLPPPAYPTLSAQVNSRLTCLS